MRATYLAVSMVMGLAACAGRAPLGGATAVPEARSSNLGDVIGDLRSLDQPSNAARATAVQDLLRRRGLDFSLQSVPNPAPKGDARTEGQNIHVDLPGPAGPEIIVGAHFDAIPLNDGSLSHGMVDNGAGVIVVTRVAEALKTRRLRHRVRVVLFDLEEAGLLGSKHFVASLDKMTARQMVNVDIAGYGDTVMAGPTRGAGTEPLHQALSRVCAARHYGCLSYPAYPPGDDMSFQAAGIPAISLAVLPALEAHQVWLLLNGGKQSGLAPGFAPAVLRTIHTRDDAVERVTPDGMTLLHDALLALLLELDGR